ncbi:MAG: polysaccharide deacetylase family protein [Candidatus Aminicenantes bacterium]|nr:polysaccharide deacetylase family protein [Candidatus Aminicenantes bacterium]
MLDRLKKKIRRLCIELGFISPYRRFGSRIIMYHGVDLIGSTEFNLRFFSKDSFEKQIIYYKKHFNIVTVEDFFNRNYTNDKFTIAVTFDDGYANNFKYVLPILEKYKVPASIFITAINKTTYEILWTDFIDIAKSLTSNEIEIDHCLYHKKANGEYYNKQTNESLKQYISNYGGYELKVQMMEAFSKNIKNFKDRPDLFDYWKLMTDDEIVELSRSKFVTIGSHGYFHNNLGNIPHKDAVEELLKSKNYLENLTQNPICSIAYPDGSYTRKLVEKASEIGFKYQLAVNYKHPEDINDDLILNRCGVYPEINSIRYFNYLITTS